MCPCGINGGQRLALCVLQCIEEDASGWALADAALEGGVSRQLGGDELANDFREGARLRVLVNRLEGHVDVKSRRTGSPYEEIGRAHVWTSVTAISRMPSSACEKTRSTL